MIFFILCIFLFEQTAVGRILILLAINRSRSKSGKTADKRWAELKGALKRAADCAAGMRFEISRHESGWFHPLMPGR
jgi:hypothetical protein